MYHLARLVDQDARRHAVHVVVRPDLVVGILQHEGSLEAGDSQERVDIGGTACAANANDSNLVAVLLSKLLNVRALSPADASKRPPEPQQDRD